MRDGGLLAAIWVTLFLGGLALAYTITAPKWRLLHNLGVVQGTVVNKTCENHGTVAYRFRYVEADISGSSQPDIPCEAVGVGQTVRVWFSKVDPSNSVLREPHPSGAHRDWSWLAIPLLVSTVVTFVAALRLRFARHWGEL